MLPINCNVCVCFKVFEKEIRYCFVPNENKRKLENDMQSLSNAKEVIEKNVNEQIALNPTKKCKEVVTNWMREVSQLQVKVSTLLQSHSNVRCPKRTFSCLCNIKRGRSISELLRQVEKLDNKRRDFEDQLVEQADPASRERVPNNASKVIGMERPLSEILAGLQDESVNVIGVHGGGGIGKTTLMAELNNNLYPETRSFGIIISLNISRGADTNKIQKLISQRVGHEHQDEADTTHRAKILLQTFSCGKKFLFLMDDLWKEFNLEEVGIPNPKRHKNIKLIFTTRSEEVCNKMCPQQTVKLEHLNPDNSLQLFREIFGGNVNFDSDIRTYARRIVERCGGLPLAIITVAKAFSTCKTGREWQQALNRLMESPNDVEGVEDNLFHILKFSFDELNRTHQLCLLHCALYPEDVWEEDIIYQWIGEGLLDDKGCCVKFADLRKKGLGVMLKLKSASLLENSIRGDVFFKMHHSVRDTCLWISDGKRGPECVFEMRTSSNDKSGTIIKSEKWERATKISLVQSEIQHFGSQTPLCPKLVTLLLTDCHKLEEIHDDFFRFMPVLRVLDLRDTKLKKLPASIRFLQELHYLDLRSTLIESLPDELGYLTKLTQLHLSSAKKLEVIRKEAVSPLKMLEHLCTEKTPYNWVQTEDKNLLLLEDFKDFNRLSELGLNITSHKAFCYLFSNEEICGMIKYIVLCGNDFGTAHVMLAYEYLPHVTYFKIKESRMERLTLKGTHHLKHLEKLHLENNIKLRRVTFKEDEDTCETVDASKLIQRSDDPEGRFRLVRCIIVEGSHLIKNVNFVRQLPFLEELHVIACRGLEEIVRKVDQEIERTQDII